MPIVAYTLLPLGQPALSSQVNSLFNAAYTLVNGQLDFQNFGDSGVKLSQINGGTFGGTSTSDATITGGLAITGGLLIGNGSLTGATNIQINNGASQGFIYFIKNATQFGYITVNSSNILFLNNFQTTTCSPINAFVAGSYGATISASTYNGNIQNTHHMVVGSGTADGSGNLTVPLTNKAQFTGPTTYCVIGTIQSSASPATSGSTGIVGFNNTGASFTFNTGYPGCTIHWVAVGY
jgi:hypothetical protein